MTDEEAGLTEEETGMSEEEARLTEEEAKQMDGVIRVLARKKIKREVVLRSKDICGFF